MGTTSENSNSSTTKSNRVQKRNGPSLASIRRNKVLSTEGHTVRFLYLILKQLELKPVNWEEIAEKTSLSSGHAARTRFNRFRRQMDKTLRSEEILEAKLENTEDEDSRSATMGVIEEEVKSFNPFGIKNEHFLSGMKFEQGAGDHWSLTGQPFQIKAESKSPMNLAGRVKFEIGHNDLPSAPLSRRDPSAIIKIEDDDAMDTGEACKTFKPCRKDSSLAWRRNSRNTNQSAATRLQQRSGSVQLQRQDSRKTSFTAGDPDVEVVSVNGQPLTFTPSSLSALRDPFNILDNTYFDTNNEWPVRR